MTADHLRLRAVDSESIGVVAAAIQDAIFSVGQVRYDTRGRSFTLRLSRYRHEVTSPSRIESGLRFDSILSVRRQGVSQDADEAYAVILDLTFNETEDGQGVCLLSLAGGGQIELSVETVDITLADIGDARPTKKIPQHET